tara:strand:- start:313 stop:840 length:528 start_codon:yes stop_codon:yes gene_type:complete
MKVHKMLDMFGQKERSREERVNFCCKSIDPIVLPQLEQDSMNSHGNTKVKDVSEYVFFKDGLNKYVRDAPPAKNKRKDDVQYKKASEYLDLVLLTNIPDEKTGGRIEIRLQPDMTLDTVRRYLYDLIEIEGKVKSMPLHYRLRDPTLSKQYELGREHEQQLDRHNKRKAEKEAQR